MNKKHRTELLSAAVRAGDAAAAQTVRHAVQAAGGDLHKAAAKLGTSMRSLQRWIASTKRLADLRRPNGRPRKDAA